MNKNSAALGIDCGGTNIKIALVRTDGKILDSVLEPIDFDCAPQVSVHSMAEKIQRFIHKNKAAGIASVGMGIAGEVDQSRGIVRFSPNLGWTDVPLKKFLSQKLNLKIFIENDANCAAWGAFCLDAGRNCDNLLCLTLGTGVGGGIVLNKKLYRGSTGSAGEIGHMTVQYDGRRCKCGNFGCLESLIGAWGLVKTAEEGMRSGRASNLKKLIQAGSKLTPQLLAEAARKKDPFCVKLWQTAGEQLGSALSNLVNIFNPDRIVLCGGVSKAGNLILRPALRSLKKRAFKTPVEKAEITVSKYDQQLGVAGAALLFLE